MDAPFALVLIASALIAGYGLRVVDERLRRRARQKRLAWPGTSATNASTVNVEWRSDNLAPVRPFDTTKADCE